MTFEQILALMQKIHTAKNSDYGNSYHELIEEYGDIAGLIPIENKFKRLKQLINSGNPKVNESIEDTLFDLANYCVMLLEWKYTGMKTEDKPE